MQDSRSAVWTGAPVSMQLVGVQGAEMFYLLLSNWNLNEYSSYTVNVPMHA